MHIRPQNRAAVFIVSTETDPIFLFQCVCSDSLLTFVMWCFTRDFNHKFYSNLSKQGEFEFILCLEKKKKNRRPLSYIISWLHKAREGYRGRCGVFCSDKDVVTIS